jgi:hypothetical protein
MIANVACISTGRPLFSTLACILIDVILSDMCFERKLSKWK